jgi:Zn-dependent peptidase ImmA (M78 family)
MFKAPYFSKDELRRRAESFLSEYNPDGTIPVPIERIVESHFGIDIVPMPGLQTAFDVVAFITKDLKGIWVDEYVYLNRSARYRFSLAHELAHRLLHPDLWRQIEFHDIASWKAAIIDSIPERDYGYIEFHASSFAGLVLVPVPDLRKRFLQCVDRARQHGVEVADADTGARDIVESYIAEAFEVSPAVVHRRIEEDRLWESIG